MTNILGISAYYHDSAAALVRDGEIVAAAQEERFTRKKHDPEFPARAMEYCLREAGIEAKDLDYLAFYDKPFIKFERLLKTYLVCAPVGLRSFVTAMPEWMGKKLWLKELLAEKVGEVPVLFTQHHESHAASAFYPSPFDEAAIITVDGVGEWTTTSIGVGRGHKIELVREIRFPHSLGLLYSAFTYFTGFKVNSGEYKLMGLAPYGEPRYVDLIKKELIDIRDDGSFRLNLKYFDYMAGLRMTNKKFAALFGGPERQPETPITRREMDMARSVQVVTEEVMLKMARYARETTGMKNLCLAGGVALNCVANGLIQREGPFEEIWIQPAAGDAGGALGAALFAWHAYLGKERPPRPAGGRDRQSASYLGPEFKEDAIRAYLEANNIPHRRLPPEEVAATAAALIAGHKVVGWFQGRMEFGPRALGGRSIIGDPRDPEMQKTMNVKIKFRESFRPFAPTVLADRAAEYFEFDRESPYMLLTAYVRPERRLPVDAELAAAEGLDKLKILRSYVPAITHVDYSARLQTVCREDNRRYYDLIAEFDRLTGCPIIINTSFNVRGEPIVCAPEDAYRCFMRTNMDYLFLGEYLLDKTEQPEMEEKEDWRAEFPPD